MRTGAASSVEMRLSQSWDSVPLQTHRPSGDLSAGYSSDYPIDEESQQPRSNQRLPISSTLRTLISNLGVPFSRRPEQNPLNEPEKLARFPPDHGLSLPLSNRREYSPWPITNHIRTGPSSGLRTYARAIDDIDKRLPDLDMALDPSYVLKNYAGRASQISKLQSTMLKVRSEAFSVGLPVVQSPPTQLLHKLHEEYRPLTNFWTDNELNSLSTRFGSEGSTVLSYLDQLADQVGSPYLALTVSFVFLKVARELPELASQAGEDMLKVLASKRIVKRLIQPMPSSSTHVPDSGLQLAGAVLFQLANVDRFEEIFRIVCPRAEVNEPATLRRYLQAGVYLQEKAKGVDSIPGADAHADGVDSCFMSLSLLRETDGEVTPTSLARRVYKDACSRLRLGTAVVAPNPRQMADAFFWDNGFFDEMPGTPLHDVKSSFMDTVAALKNANEAGPLRSLCLYGLAGADRNGFSDEEVKIKAMVDSVAIRELVNVLQGALVDALREKGAEPRDHRVDYGRLFGAGPARLLALLCALDAWSPDQHPQLSLKDIIDGVQVPVATLPQMTNVGVRCTELLSQMGSDRQPMRVPISAHLEEQVVNELKTIKLNFYTVVKLGREIGIQFDRVLEEQITKVEDTIDAKSRPPASSSTDDIVNMLTSCLDDIQGGNHVRMSNIHSGGYSARGASLNVSVPLRKYVPLLKGTAVVVRGDARHDHSIERVMRVGASTHGGEIFLGQEVRKRTAAGTGLFIGSSIFSGLKLPFRFGGSFDIMPLGRDRSNYHGAMLRIRRRVVDEFADPVAPRMSHNDDEYRATMGALVRMLLEGAVEADSAQRREILLQQIISAFADRDLSLTLMDRQVNSLRSEASMGLAASVSGTVLGKFGQRLGLGTTATYEKGWYINVTEKESTGSFRVHNVRQGWFNRKKLSADLSTNSFVNPAGLPTTPLAATNAAFGDSGATVRSRCVVYKGKISPEKCFSDTETADKEFFKEIILSEKDKWVEMFAYPHRALPRFRALDKGREALEKFFHKMDTVREETHVYYARQRMHPDVSDRLEELTCLSQFVPLEMAGFHAELNQYRDHLASDSRSWSPAALSVFQRSVVQDSRGASVSGARYAGTHSIDGEREVIFDSSGWANLRQHEREKKLTHLNPQGVDGDSPVGVTRARFGS